MAFIVPSDLSPLSLSSGHSRELETLAKLKQSLGEGHTVFHSVHWSKGWASSPVVGEVDFIVLNGAGDVLVIEQKSGALVEGKEGLAKVYDGKSKSVGDQIHRCVDALRDKFRRQVGDGLEIGYLLYCPDHRVAKLAAAGLDAERIVDARDAGALAARIEELVPARGASPHGQRVRRFFEQELHLVPDIHAHAQAGERAFTRLSGGLAATVSNLHGAPLRLAVRGTAGCGKSVVALQAYEAAVAAGKRPLLVCFNRSLRERLKLTASPSGRVETWHGLLDAFLTDIGRPIPYDGQLNNEVWARAFDEAIAADVPDHWRFDRIIVDEGQDFDGDWTEGLSLFAKPDADWIWLDDPDQRIQFGRSAAPAWPPAGFTGLRARANFRSPYSIARYLQRVLPFEFELANELPGLGVGFFAAKKDLGSAVAARVTKLVSQGFKHEDIIVLTLRGLNSASLRDADKVGGLALSRFTGGYDMFGNQVWSGGKVRYETVRRFKGQQAPAVIVTDAEPSDRSTEDPERLAEWQRLIFVALSRATLRAEIIGDPANKYLEPFYWGADERG